MMRAWALVAGLMLLSPSGHSQPAQADSLLVVWASQGQPDSVRYDALDRAIHLLRSTMQDSALVLAETMEKRSASEKRPWWTARALILRSMMLEDKLAFAEALESSVRAEQIADELQDHLLKGQALAAQASTLALSGQAERSIRVSIHAERELKAASAMEQLATLRLNMAEELMILEDWDRARSTLHNVLANSPTPRNAMAAQLGLGKIVRRSGGPAIKALEHYRLAQAIVNEHGLDRYRARVGTAFGNAYLVMGQYDSAAFHFREAIAQARTRGLRQDGLNARLGLAESLIGMQRPKAALTELDAVSAQLRGISRGHLHKELYRLYSTAHKAVGNAPQALRYEELKDSVVTELDMLERQRAMQQWDLRARLEADSLRVVGEKRTLAENAGAALRAERDHKLIAAGGAAAVLVLAIVLWRTLRLTRREKARSEEILNEMLPEEISRELKETGAASTRHLMQVSVLFTDFEGFTDLSARMDQADLVAEIDSCFKAFDDICHRHGVEKIKTIGDAYMAAAGLKSEAHNTAADAVHAALEMQTFIETRYAERSAQSKHAFRMRAGIHTGPVVAGIVGVKKFQYDIWGDTVNIASRMESSGKVGQVNISEATYMLVKDAVDSSPLSVLSSQNISLTTDNSEMTTRKAFTFTPRGKVQAKGKGELEMYFVSEP
jgi:adenylate cyclase